MLLEQEIAIRKVAAGTVILSDALCKRCCLDEEDALEIVRSLPDLEDKIQEGKMHELLTEALKRTPRPRRVVMDGPDPDEYYPGHKKFMPRVTTKTTFNEHVAQAMYPYMKAIVHKISKDRGLVPPDDRTMKAVLDKTDWARAAFEAKKINPRSPSAVKNFVIKYFFRPLDRLSKHGVSMAAIMSAVMGIRIAMTLFTSLTQMGEILDVMGKDSMLTKNVRGFSRWGQRRAHNRFYKKTPRKLRPRKFY